MYIRRGQSDTRVNVDKMNPQFFRLYILKKRTKEATNSNSHLIKITFRQFFFSVISFKETVSLF